MPYLPYEEAGITTILSLTSFILLLNITRYILDRLLYCGIIAEILIGIIYGLPVGGTSWLPLSTQTTMQSLGYLGLTGLVFEGGLSTNLSLLRKNAGLSISIATVGLLGPIALSFLLLLFPFQASSGTKYPTPLAAFSAGASLCSTSLGTTFAILSSVGLQRSRIGTVLVGAAMMDDVVGLVMVNIVTTLGNGGVGGWIIARPIVASFGLLLSTLGVAAYVLKPIWLFLAKSLDTGADFKSKMRAYAIKTVSNIPHSSFLLCTAILVIFVTIADFIDASVLFAAFIAGGLISCLWNAQYQQQSEDDQTSNAPVQMYEQHYKTIMEYILVPFFFASIGFSIPITDMFSAQIVWKGIMYSLLMIIGKGAVSLVIYSDYFLKTWQDKHSTHPRSTIPASSIGQQPTKPPHSDALLVGFAMIARGEIGFLVASLSQSSETLTFGESDGDGGEVIFLVIIWAVVLCTIIGPVAVGIVVRTRKNSGADASENS